MAVTLSNSPIREVLVGVSTNITEAQLKQFESRAKIERFYPNKQISPGLSFDQSRNFFVHTPGYTFSTKDGKQTMFVDKTRLTISNRDKYESFDEFIAPFLDLFRVFVDVVGDIKQGSDVGLRYINEMFLTPAELKMFKICFSDSNGELDNYGAGFPIVKDDALINVNIQKNTLPDSQSRVIFDIDAHVKYTNIEEALERLRALAARVEEYKKLATNDAPTSLGLSGVVLQRQVDAIDDQARYWSMRWSLEDDIATRLKQGTLSEEEATKLKDLLASNKDVDGLFDYERAYLQVFGDDKGAYNARFNQNYKTNKQLAIDQLKTRTNENIVAMAPITNKDFVVAERKELYSTIIDSDPTLRRQAVNFDKLSDSEKMEFVDNILKKSDDYLGASRGDVISAEERVRLSGGTEEKWAASSRGSQNSRTNRITINLDPNTQGVNDIEEIMNTAAHEDAHRVDALNASMGMLGDKRVELSDKVYSTTVSKIYNNSLMEQSSNAIGDAVGADIKRLTENRWQQLVALEDVTPAYKTARVVEGAKETQENQSLDLIMKFIDSVTQ